MKHIIALFHGALTIGCYATALAENTEGRQVLNYLHERESVADKGSFEWRPGYIRFKFYYDCAE